LEMMKNKIAVFGGTFDPIHRGHVNLSAAAADECGLDELVFMPNYISPFKQNTEVAPGADRAEMVRGILHYHPKFRLSTYELSRSEPSYTYDTLSYFRRTMTDAEILFIIGFDSVLNIDTWYRGEEIIREFPLITGIRPNTSTEDAMAKIKEYREKYSADITVLRLKPFDASSTEIRKRLQSGSSISDLVLPETEEYIRKHGLYQYGSNK